MEITLTSDIEQALLEQAQRRGITTEQFALETLRQQFVYSTQSESSAEAQGTLADFLAASIGVLHSNEHVPGGARMSEATSEEFAKWLTEKREQRPLKLSDDGRNSL
ncbi:MAG: hypothetical protein M3154_05350 [Candidatus Eremiobacteraeota bacterium]|nr:hypothetical protein [Candidatus Eremiobacteraeota bacterium]